MSDDAIFAGFQPLIVSDEAVASGQYDIPLYHYWQGLPPEERAAVFEEQSIRGERIRRFHARYVETLRRHAPWRAKNSRQSARQARYRYFQERIAAEAGDAGPQNNFGYLCYHGRGVEQDDAEAAQWFLLAARQKHPDALYNRGFLHYRGQGIAQNYMEAAACFQMAEYQYYRALRTAITGTPDIASSFGILTEARGRPARS